MNCHSKSLKKQKNVCITQKSEKNQRVQESLKNIREYTKNI